MLVEERATSIDAVTQTIRGTHSLQSTDEAPKDTYWNYALHLDERKKNTTRKNNYMNSEKTELFVKQACVEPQQACMHTCVAVVCKSAVYFIYFPSSSPTGMYLHMTANKDPVRAIHTTETADGTRAA